MAECTPSDPTNTDIEVIYGYEDPSKNLLKNWDFEDPITDDDWLVSKADVSRSDDAHTGKWSLHVHSRSHKHGQTFQRVYNLKQNAYHYYSFFIKFLTQPQDEMYFCIKIFVLIKFPGQDTKQKENVCQLNYQTAPASMWQQLGGEFKTPDKDFEYIETHMEIGPQEVDFLVDTASLIELVYDPNWKETSDKLIDKHRKSDVKLRIKLPKDVDPKDIKVKINQIKRDFGFGSAISADHFNAKDEHGQKYRDCFFKHFDWAVFCNDTKWKPMEKKKGQIKFQRVDDAVALLHEKGVTVRGHAIHWNNQKNCPVWVQDEEGEALQAEINRRLDYVVQHYKGKFVHWDVCNEQLHHRFFEQKTENPDQLEHLFRRAHEIDPECQLYLNDYQVFRGGVLTSGQANLARELLYKKVPLHGIGVQSHLKCLPIPVEVLRKRAQIITAVGLPVTVTELTVHSDDRIQRAQCLEEALRVFFSQPEMIAVVFWNFSDQHGLTMGDGDMALFEGPDFEANEAGQTLQRLLESWKTNKSFRPKSTDHLKTFRAFHGQYELEVTHKGQVVWQQSFRVQKGQDHDLNLDIDLGDTMNPEQSVSKKDKHEKKTPGGGKKMDVLEQKPVEEQDSSGCPISQQSS